MTTATSRLLRTINEYRERLLQREAQAAATMDRYHDYTIAQYITPRLNKLYDAISKKYKELRAERGLGETAPVDVPESWIYQRIRLEGLQLLISNQIDNFGALALSQTRMLQYFGLNLGLVSAQMVLDRVVPTQIQKALGLKWKEVVIELPGLTPMRINAAFGVPSTKAIENLVGATRKGSPLADLFNGFGAEAAEKAISALVNGVTAGNNPRAIAPIVQAALGVSRNRALTISRTEALRCYRNASVETYKQNSDVVDGMVRVAALNARTCAACIALHGKIYKLGEDPGFHPNDRCSLAPLTKSWDELLGPLGIDASSVPDTRPQIQSGPDWFNEQSEDVKQQILGAAKYAAYNNGDFDLKDIVQHHHDPDWGHSISEKPLKDLVK